MKLRLALVLVSLFCVAALSAQPTPSTLPLVQQADLVYQGAFRLPASSGGTNTFNYGGRGLVYVPANNSLMLSGANVYGLVAEVSIPTPATGTLASLPRATMLQTYKDVLDGKRMTVDGSISSGVYIGGLFPVPPHLIVSVYAYYDGSGTQNLSHFRTSLTFSAVSGQVLGPYPVGSFTPGAGFVSGYMTAIPPAWQTALGGPALTGNCCIPIIGRSSYGPSVTVFDPADVGVKTPVPGTRVLGYPTAHTTIGGYTPPGELYNGSVKMGGVAFPVGTRSLLFVGRKPTNKANYCYGQGTNDPALHRVQIPGQPAGVVYCYDPTDSGKGTHGYPYQSFVWAYDANDLAAVKAGTKQYWEPVPYATWELTLPYDTTTAAQRKYVDGVAYNPTTQQLFLAAAFQDGSAPVVHVFKVTAPPPPDPCAGANLSSTAWGAVSVTAPSGCTVTVK